MFLKLLEIFSNCETRNNIFTQKYTRDGCCLYFVANCFKFTVELQPPRVS